MIGVYRQVRHKNLVQLVGLVLHGPQVRSIVMELMGKVSVLQQRGKRGEGRGGEREMRWRRRKEI